MSRSASKARRHGEKMRFEGERTCRSSGKRRYATKKKALTAMNNIRSHKVLQEGGRLPQSVYKCSACHDWHMTGLEPRP